MPRAIWSGAVTFGMVSIPVDLYSTVEEKDVHFHQLHRSCGTRIKLQKYCPKHEKAVPNDEIVKAYEVSKGRYVVMEGKDFENLPVPSLHTVTVGAFVKAEEIDPVFYDTTYYIRPEESGRKPFALLIKAMQDKKVNALGQIALRARESLCLLRPSGDSMVLETLFYPDEIRESPSMSTKEIKVDARELKMATDLVDLLYEDFDPGQYHDQYREALLNRIEEKAKGEEVAESEEVAPSTGKVIDIMDALRASIEAAKKHKKAG